MRAYLCTPGALTFLLSLLLWQQASVATAVSKGHARPTEVGRVAVLLAAEPARPGSDETGTASEMRGSPRDALQRLGKAITQLKKLRNRVIDINKAYSEIPETKYEKKRNKVLHKKKISKSLLEHHRRSHRGSRFLKEQQERLNETKTRDTAGQSDDVLAQWRRFVQTSPFLMTRDWVCDQIIQTKQHIAAGEDLLQRMGAALERGEWSDGASEEVGRFAASTHAYGGWLEGEFHNRQEDLTDLLKHYEKLHPEVEVSWANVARKEG